MSKYVRTEAGIYERAPDRENRVYGKSKNGSIYGDKIEFVIYGLDCDMEYGVTDHYTENIIAEADTIGELVDFVAVKFKWEDLPSVHSLKELYKRAEEKGWDKNTVFDNHKFLLERSGKTHSVEYIKYAIATDKGLIYVAQMNDKGVLELL